MSEEKFSSLAEYVRAVMAMRSQPRQPDGLPRFYDARLRPFVPVDTKHYHLTPEEIDRMEALAERLLAAEAQHDLGGSQGGRRSRDASRRAVGRADHN